MWKKTEDSSPQPSTSTPERSSYAAPEPRRAAPSTPGSRAVIGDSIRVQGDISGNEDLLIQGEIEGNVHLESNSVTVGPSGRVKADVHGRNISVEGKVQGNLFADEQVVVRESGEVRGNITAPRVSLEDGAKFKGAIDMEPRAAKAGGGKPGAAAGGGAAASSGGASSEAPGKGSQGGSSSNEAPRAAAAGQGKA